MGEPRIPKIIHFCWFGGKPKPESVEYCMDSWKKVLSDYQIMEWNESNFSLSDANAYVKEAYQSKKWAFVSDYVRLHALKEYGGIYLDTDVEVFRRFDEFLSQEAFFGFESNDYVSTAVMGAQKGADFILDFLKEYEGRHFLLPNGDADIETTNVILLTGLLKKNGLVLNGKKQLLGKIAVFPQTYFSPNDLRNVFGRYKTENYAYHHCLASWYSSGAGTGISSRFRHYVLGKARNTIGTSNLHRMGQCELVRKIREMRSGK